MAGDGAEFDRVLARVSGPLGVEVWNVDAAQRERWETYAAEHGWGPIDWFDMPGAFAWRREPPGIWEMTWQQTTHAREMFELRLMPPEHSLVWRRQIIELLRGLGETLGRDVVLTDERTAMPLLRFDTGLGAVRVAEQPPARPLDAPPEPLCCDRMAAQFTSACDTCLDQRDCANHVVLYFPTRQDLATGEFGLPIRDGGSSYLPISHCPWCGSRVPLASGGASGEAEAGRAD
jgi:hypothetical protein